MPWSTKGGSGGGGGPWGSSGGGGNGGSPWGSGGGSGGGPTPPDFEDMIRRGQDQVRRALPGGFGSGKGILIVIGIALIIWLATGIFRVQPDEQGVVMRFGQYVRTAGPGLHYHLPSPIESVELPRVTVVNRIDVGFTGTGTGQNRDVPEESLMLTGDENIIDIDFTVLWRIGDARQFLFNIRDPEDTVKTAAESALREIIGRTDIQPALTDARQEIESATRDLLQQTIDEYGAGITVTEVQLQQVDPPQPVVDAFNEVQRARQDRQRLRNEAEAYRNDIIPRARGEAERLSQEAQAYREQVIARADGDAQRFLAVLESYRIAPDVTANRFYLETMEEVFRGVNKVIIDQGSGGEQGVVPYLPLNELQRRAAPGATGVGE